MKLPATLCGVALTGVLAAASTGDVRAAGVRVGEPAPAFAVTDFDGHEITLARFRGRPLVVNVFASWCPPCRAELPRFSKAHARYGNRVAFLGVDEQEGAEVARRFARTMRIPFTVVLDDGPLAANYRATAIPSTIFVDARGIVRSVHSGAMSSAQLERALASLNASPNGAPS